MTTAREVKIDHQTFHFYPGLSQFSKKWKLQLSRSFGSGRGRSAPLSWNLDSWWKLWAWDWHPANPSEGSSMRTDWRVDKNAKAEIFQIDQRCVWNLNLFLSTLPAFTSKTIAIPHLGFFANRGGFCVRPWLLLVLKQIWLAPGTQYHPHQVSTLVWCPKKLDKYFWRPISVIFVSDWSTRAWWPLRDDVLLRKKCFQLALPVWRGGGL